MCLNQRVLVMENVNITGTNWHTWPLPSVSRRPSSRCYLRRAAFFPSLLVTAAAAAAVAVCSLVTDI